MKFARSILAIVVGYAAVVGVIVAGYTLLGESMVNKGTAGLLVLMAIPILGGVVGGFVTASMVRLFQQLHARILGVFMLVLGLVFAATTPPHPHEPSWFPWVVAVLALPCAMLGGRLRSKV